MTRSVSMTPAGKVLVLGAVLVMSCLGCSSEDARYELSTDARGRTYKLDKNTGQTWLVTSAGEHSISKGTATQQAVQMPSSALDRLTIKKTYEDTIRNSISFTLYNGTDEWEVVHVVVHVRTTEGVRRYRASASSTMKPLTTSALVIKVDVELPGIDSWNIESATGYKSTAR
jgi:hypothetical protein